MDLEFCSRLRKHETLIGTIVSLDSLAVMEIAATSGFDWIFIETEHAGNDSATVERLLVAAVQTPCLIRLPNHDPIWIKRALDLGAAGIIVPQVNTEAQAQAIVESARYTPLGGRGVGAGRANAYGYSMSDYLRDANDGTAVLVQAEHIDAVTNAEAIAAVPGIDGVFVGPLDLSASMGLMGEIDHPDVTAALSHVREVFAAAGKPSGYYGPNADNVRARIDEGFTLVACSMDVALLRHGYTELASTLKA